MKYAIILLFVIGISIIGSNQAYAGHEQNAQMLALTATISDSPGEKFTINFHVFDRTLGTTKILSVVTPGSYGTIQTETIRTDLIVGHSYAVFRSSPDQNIIFRGAICVSNDTSFSPSFIATHKLISCMFQFDYVEIPEPEFTQIEIPISQNSDDAEEFGSGGNVVLHSRNLDLSKHLVGIKFNNIPLEQGQTVESAYIQFTTHPGGNSGGDSHLTIYGENVNNAASYENTAWNISDRIQYTSTYSEVDWYISPWNTVNESGINQQTPDLTELVQEIIDRPTWSKDNSLSFIMSKTINLSVKFAYSFDSGGIEKSPKLIITYLQAPPIEEPPTGELVIPEQSIETKKKNKTGGGCGGDCTPPTLGKDSDGKLRVENGISINGVAKDGSYYYTEYPMIYTNIGDENSIILKYFENGSPSNIEMIQLASIKEKGTSFGESQWMIEVWLNYFANDMYNPTIKEIKVFDKDNLLSDVNAKVWLSQCKSDSKDPLGCLSVMFNFTNEQVPNSPVLVAEARDYKRNVIQNIFNDGLQVVDPDYVEPTLPEPYKYECKDPALDSIMNGGDRKNCHWRITYMPHLWAK